MLISPSLGGAGAEERQFLLSRIAYGPHPWHLGTWAWTSRPRGWQCETSNHMQPIVTLLHGTPCMVPGSIQRFFLVLNPGLKTPSGRAYIQPHVAKKESYSANLSCLVFIAPAVDECISGKSQDKLESRTKKGQNPAASRFHLRSCSGCVWVMPELLIYGSPSKGLKRCLL